MTDSVSKRYRTTVACKYCGVSNLQWQNIPAGYRLYQTRANGDGTVSIVAGAPHACLTTEPTLDKADAAVEAPMELTLTSRTVAASKRDASNVAKGKGLGIRAPWHEILRTLWAAGARRILVAGPPGTGKTTTSLGILETNYRVTMTEGTGVEDLLGCFQLRKVDDDKTASTIWVNGPVPCAMLAGNGILIDEIDKMPPEIQSLMYAVMDDRPEIMLPTGDMVSGISGYGVIATTNANIAVLPDAIIDRFDAALVAVVPHPDSIAHLPAAEKGAVVNYFKSVSPDAWLWTGKPTVRRMRSYYALKQSGMLTDELAAMCVFGKSGTEILSALTTAGRDATAVVAERGF